MRLTRYPRSCVTGTTGDPRHVHVRSTQLIGPRAWRHDLRVPAVWPHFQDRDLQFAQEVAARAATAITNAHAYRRAHEANRLKDEFLATLSHELRTPLNAIVGYAQMLHLGLLEGERRTRAVAVLSRNADALKQIIDDVLDVSRITAGKLRLNVQPVDLASIVHAAIATVQPAADAKQIVVTATLDPDVPTIAADSDRLQQVLWNLLSNAVKFTPSGGAVTVCLRQTARGVDVAVIGHGTRHRPLVPASCLRSVPAG